MWEHLTMFHYMCLSKPEDTSLLQNQAIKLRIRNHAPGPQEEPEKIT
jgi:hypothetical protein